MAGVEGRPLEGRRVLVTRAGGGRDALAERLRALGAEPLEFPVIRIVEPADWRPVDDAISRLTEYEWLVFTSQNGVGGFLGRLAALGERLPAAGVTLTSGRSPDPMRIAAVGEATAAHLKRRGLPPTLVPAEYSGQGVLTALLPLLQPGTRVLLARGDLASPVLPDGLQRAGAAVDEVVVYRNVPDRSRAAELRTMLEAGAVDAVTFASPSAVTNLLGILEGDGPARLEGVTVACIGPQTAAAARRLGLRVDVMPDAATLPALADALAAALGPAPR